MVITELVLFLWVFLLLSHGVLGQEQSEVLCSRDACYTAYLKNGIFSQAHKDCVDKGGDLVAIKTEEEAKHVYGLLWGFTNNTLLNSPLKFWIGLHVDKGCVTSEDPLKGFSWTTGPKDTQESKYSNWIEDPKKTCTKERCVSLIAEMNSPNNYKWTDGKCSAPAAGYICKFNFQGMCQRVLLAGPGHVEYETPFSSRSSSLTLVPYGSFAFVSCGDSSEYPKHTLVCKNDDGTETFQWRDPRLGRQPLKPFCASEQFGCDYNNGGCEHECVEEPQNKSLLCKCKDGYVLASDLVSCVLPDNCQPNPCEHSCISNQQGFECSCVNGFTLAENKRNCMDINECLSQPCNQTCINTAGSFQCRCHTGFKQHGTECLDVDECINSPCSQGCLNTHGSYLCSCNSGYAIGSDKISCLDTDECVLSPCAESCHNTPGSYQCSCPNGFLLSSDRISCIPEAPNPNTFINEGLVPEDDDITSSVQRESTPQPTPNPVSPDLIMDIEKHKESKGHPILSTSVAPDVLSGNSSMNHVARGDEEGHNLVILISILCSCVVLLLLSVVGGVLCYRKKNEKKSDPEKQPSAADKYCWVPEQSENKVGNKDYR